MNERNKNHPAEPWDADFYETGSTRPPKNHGGLIAVLLIVLIVFGGIVSAVGIMNFRLFQNTAPDSDDPLSSIAFYSTTDGSAESQMEHQPEATRSSSDVTVQLNPSPQSAANIPQEGGRSLQEIYANTIDSVVSIISESAVSQNTGTGVILSEEGYVVTNAHVVEDALNITVLLTDGQELNATLVGADAISDLAVLQIEGQDLKPAEFGDSGVLQVGDAVVAIGDPLGVTLRGTMTNGIVSAINRNITMDGRTMTLIQTNAALNSGNSGGPLLNCYGQVIGINTMKIGDNVTSSGVEGLGFAIPSTTVKEIVDQLISQGYVSGRPRLGISGESVSLFHQRYYGIPAGLYITFVEEGSAADEIGMEPGDVLISVENTRIYDLSSLNTVLYSYQAGDTIAMVVYRNGRQYALQLTLGEATK